MNSRSVKARDAMNRRLYNNQPFVLTAIYRVFVMIYRNFAIYNFHQKSPNLSQDIWIFP
ncbi:MAG: hypothetical protein V7L27_02880 [Nostoc sp.]